MQTTPRNSSTSRYNSNDNFLGQSRKFKVSSQPNFSLSDKTCGCPTPLHLRKSRVGPSYPRLCFHQRPAG